MLPRRRYRLLLVIAAIFVILVYRAAQSHEQHGADSGYRTGPGGYPPPRQGGGSPSRPRPYVGSPAEPGQARGGPGQAYEGPVGPPPPTRDELQEDAPGAPAPAAVELPALKGTEDEPGSDLLPTRAVPAAEDAAPVTGVPDSPATADAGPDPPPAPTSSRVHWRKFPEDFPVAEESYILLPTGTPKALPRIQFDFARGGEEAPAARREREGRLSEVRAEMSRAWRGYRAFAWMRDELSPVSRAYRDPFCGWAATLVDGLDTLWIMGLRDEFDEAARAVGAIDFTRSETRRDIPVFETTIRYLGGLLAAYDLSGGAAGGYGVLLEKAEELAGVLMGAFDTPNRMPVLYYGWRPESVSQRHRATVVNVAELGSLLVEFTRLSQLTGRREYYDAVARVADAFEDLQARGTTLDGIFPESLDASGCNRTATNLARQAAYEAVDELQGDKAAPKPPKPPMRSRDGTGLGEIGSSFAGPWSPPETEEAGYDAVSGQEARETGGEGGENRLSKRGYHQANAQGRVSGRAPRPATDMWSTLKDFDMDCVKQPDIVPSGFGYESYSMGGSQDSTYEYFTKQYILLGGLEPKYRTMHEKSVAAIKRWLLYRPMTPDGDDILFSAKLSTRGDPSADATREYEVPHLTCFLGGMFALGAKVFGLEEDDLDVARRLTDGCVWAYGATPSGIMPEGSTVLPCADAGGCVWNETAWYQALDPLWESRDRQVADYYANKEDIEERLQFVVGPEVVQRAWAQEDGPGSGASKLRKRDTEPGAEDYRAAPGPADGPSAESIAAERAGEPLAAGLRSKELPLGDAAAADGSGQVDPGDVNRPLTHEEYVKARIKTEKIPKGFVRVTSRKYILRPEAIESVWYMYRITGDPAWQDKGWAMWRSVIGAVRTEAGASALVDVLDEEPAHADEMESFWVAETLKYFYLLFAEPDVLSLDEWVLNTEAHPLRRPDFEG